MIAQLFSPQNYQWNAFAVLVFIVGSVLASGIGLFVFLRDPRSIRHLSFFLVCTSTGFWLVTINLLYVCLDPILAAEWYRKVTFLGVSLIAPSIFFFSATLLPNQKFWLRWSWVMYAIAFIFYLLGFSGSGIVAEAQRFPWGYYPKYGPVGHIYFWFFVICYIAALINIARSVRLEKNEIRKVQNKFFLNSFIIAFFGSIDFITKLTPLVVYPFGFIPVAIWILVVAYAIIRYRALDIQTVFHKTVMWTALSAVALLPLALVVYLGYGWYQQLSPWLFTLVMLPICAFFSFYLRWIQPRIDFLFNRRKVDLEEVLDRFTRNLVHLKTPKELLERIVKALQEAFDLEHFSLLLIDLENGWLQTVHRAGWPIVVKETKYPLDHPLLKWFEENDLMIDFRFLEIDPAYRTLPKEGNGFLKGLQTAYLVPQVLNQQLLGIIALGPKKNQTPFTEVETHFLNRFRAQAVVALSNSILYGRVEEEVEKRTKELLETKDQLTRAEKLATLGTLAGGVAHEINNPLTAILTNVQMMKMDCWNEEEKETLSLMEEATKRCRTIVQKLMTYARRSPERVRDKNVDLREVIKDTAALLEYQFRQDNVQVRTEINGAQNAVIRGSRSELEQVVTNLLLNARDAVKAAGRKGEIQIQLSEDKGSILLSVADNGQGIAKEHLPKIFDPFFTTKDVGKGTGLGLSICQSIVEQHGGKISVQTQWGEGTTFLLEFPLPA